MNYMALHLRLILVNVLEVVISLIIDLFYLSKNCSFEPNVCNGSHNLIKTLYMLMKLELFFVKIIFFEIYW